MLTSHILNFSMSAHLFAAPALCNKSRFPGYSVDLEREVLVHCPTTSKKQIQKSVKSLWRETVRAFLRLFVSAREIYKACYDRAGCCKNVLDCTQRAVLR